MCATAGLSSSAFRGFHGTAGQASSGTRILQRAAIPDRQVREMRRLRNQRPEGPARRLVPALRAWGYRITALRDLESGGK